MLLGIDIHVTYTNLKNLTFTPWSMRSYRLCFYWFNFRQTHPFVEQFKFKVEIYMPNKVVWDVGVQLAVYYYLGILMGYFLRAVRKII